MKGDNNKMAGKIMNEYVQQETIKMDGTEWINLHFDNLNEKVPPIVTSWDELTQYSPKSYEIDYINGRIRRKQRSAIMKYQKVNVFYRYFSEDVPMKVENQLEYLLKGMKM